HVGECCIQFDSFNSNSRIYLIVEKIAGSFEDDINPTRSMVGGVEGDTTTLSCSYTGSVDNLQWYHQYPRTKPEYLNLNTKSGYVQKTVPSPMSTQVHTDPDRLCSVLLCHEDHSDRKQTSLTDSALYYIAVRPTVTGNLHTLGEEAVDQQSGHVTALEGGLVTFSCNYTTSSTSPDLFWYIQLTRDSPQYVLRRDRYSEGSNSDEFKKRFDSKLNFTSSFVPLMIQTLQPSDSASYFCALRSTVTTDDSVTVQKLRVECCSDNVTSFSMFDDTQKEEETRKCRGEDSVTQSPGDVIATEGEQVTLDCQFDTLDTDPFLFWYKQGANDFPKYMLRRTTFGSDNAIEFQGRFNAHLNLTKILSASKSVPLTIQRLQLSDSAVYYCALRPTVTTGYTSPLQKLYRQYPKSAPQLLVKEYVDITPGFTLNHDKKAKPVDLEISSAEVTDSARYYCALRPTVTGNPETLYKT
ncbi:unnamed protein product, partial [Coregonus sp. 'balchen']